MSVRFSIARLGALFALATSFAAGWSAPASADTRLDGGRLAADKLLVVDCALPGEVRQLGSRMTYITPRRAVKTSMADCELRGGEYVAQERASLGAALAVWLPQAQAGDKEAQTYVGELFERGLNNTPPDYAAAAEWYRKAADQGYARAQINLAVLYEKGLGVPKDTAAALNLYRKASGLGELFTPGQVADITAEQKATIDKLQRELMAVRQELDKARQDLSRKQGAAASEIERLEKQKAQAAQAGNIDLVRRLEGQLRASEQQLDAQRREVARLEANAAKYRDQLAATSTEREALRQELETLRQQQRTAANDVDSRRSQAAELERRLQRTEQELAQVRQQASTQSTGSKDRDARIQALTAQVQSQRDDLDRRAREIERATQEAERYRTQVASLEEATKKLGGTLAAVTSERDRLRGELDAARQSESTAAKQAEERRQRIAELDRLLAQSKQELAASRQQPSTGPATDERRRIEQDVAKWQAEIERQASEIKRAEEDARRYRAQVEELERRMAASTPDEKPVIRIIDPPYVATRDSGVIKIQTNLDKRDVVGQVFARSAVVSLTINDKSYPIAKDGMFKASVPVTTMMTPVTVVAVDARGNRSAVEFSLRRPMDAVALGVNFGTFHALVIGNQKYEKLPSLQTSAEDARAVADVLEKRYGFKVTRLVNANRYAILSELNRLRADLTEKDNLLIYYAGHGEVDPAKNASWLPVDAELDSDANWIPSTNLNAYLSTIKAKHILVVSDSCYSGTMFRGLATDTRPKEDARAEWIKAVAQKRSRQVLSSGGNEPVLDGGGGNHSAFARMFLNVLETNDELLDGTRLYDQIKAQVLQVAQSYGMTQEPQYLPIQQAGHELGDFLFVPQAPPKTAAR